MFTRTIKSLAADNRLLLLVATLLVGFVVLAVSTGPEGTGRTGGVPDFQSLVAGPERKSEFFAFMRPLLESQNEEVLRQRQRLLELQDQGELGYFEHRWLTALAEQYEIATEDDDGNPFDNQVLISRLLPRVDVVPVSLGLAQAAKESGWGTSRFARQGNNYFGEWCFSEGCGIVPGARADGRTHEVEAFASPADSVASYVQNINTHRSYKSFRDARKAQRERKGPLSSMRLAEELSQYSERRGAYVDEIKQLIITNRLDAPRQAAAERVPSESTP